MERPGARDLVIVSCSTCGKPDSYADPCHACAPARTGVWCEPTNAEAELLAENLPRWRQPREARQLSEAVRGPRSELICGCGTSFTMSDSLIKMLAASQKVTAPQCRVCYAKKKAA